MRRAARRDCNEVPIIRVFQGAGAAVEMLSGKGTPDLLVSYLGVLHLVEVKRENAGLTEDQVEWHDEWVRLGAKRPEIVRTEAHARKLLRMWAREFAQREAARDGIEEDLAKGPLALEREAREAEGA